MAWEPVHPGIKTNELKKGDLVELRNGWLACIEDNRKGNIRLCTVYGFEVEMGSVYAHDMISHGGQMIVHTPDQLKLRKTLETLRAA